MKSFICNSNSNESCIAHNCWILEGLKCLGKFVETYCGLSRLLGHSCNELNSASLSAEPRRSETHCSAGTPAVFCRPASRVLRAQGGAGVTYCGLASGYTRHHVTPRLRILYLAKIYSALKIEGEYKNSRSRLLNNKFLTNIQNRENRFAGSASAQLPLCIIKFLFGRF